MKKKNKKEIKKLFKKQENANLEAVDWTSWWLNCNYMHCIPHYKNRLEYIFYSILYKTINILALHEQMTKALYTFHMT